MDKVAMYRDSIDKIAGEYREIAKAEQQQRKLRMKKKELKDNLKVIPRSAALGIAGNIVGGEIGRAGFSPKNKKMANALGVTGAIAGAYTKKKELNKKAEMEKEAALVNRASKVINGVKRGGELLSGSGVKNLNNQLTSLNNSAGTNFSKSVDNGKKIMDTQNKLNSEIGKVRKARTVAGAAIGVPIGIGLSSNKDSLNQ